MGREASAEKLRWRAYGVAASAAAVYLGKVVPVGTLDLSRDYITDAINATAEALGLEDETHFIPAPVCLCINWPILAQRKIGRPAYTFISEGFAELPVEDDPYGLQAMERNWNQISILAETLLNKVVLSEAQALALLASNAFNWQQHICRLAAAQLSPRFERLH